MKEHRGKILILSFFVAFHVIFSLFLAAPGHLTIDEGVYDLMTRDLVSSGRLSVWNGYEEFASPELALPTLNAQDGALVSQYPGLFPFVAAPFYALFGFRGLFLLNALAFAGGLGLCFLIARRLFHDTALAVNACLILGLTTFAWEYAQSAWPHATSMMFVTLAMYLTVCALQAGQGRGQWSLAALAGLTLGFGVGVRLDTVFALPAVVLPFLFVHPWRPRAAFAACAGLIPGLIVLAAINHAKFGTLSPFSYGVTGQSGSASGIMGYLPIAGAGLALVLGAWSATRPAGRRFLDGNRGAALLTAMVLGAVILLTPPGWALVSKLANGAYQLLVDVRVRDLGIEEGGLARGPGGGMVYLGSLKKSLLQSCPYLVALALPLVSLLRGRDQQALGVLFLVPAGFIGVYAYFAWHGGLAFNLRYFVPALPFLAILAAYAWRDIASDLAPLWARVAVAGAVAVFAVHFLAAFPQPASLAAQEAVFLSLPLAIAGLLGLLLLAVGVTDRERGRAFRGAACSTMLVAMVWGGLVSLTYDFPRSYFIRAARAGFSDSVGPLIAPDSILFVQYGDQFFGLIERGQVRFAMPHLDDYASFRPLIDFHLSAGRRVYLWRAPEIAQTLEARPLLSDLAVTPLYQDQTGDLVELGRGQQAQR